MMKWTMVGTLVDVGDLPEGRGIVLQVGDNRITITGLEHSMVSWLAKSYGQDIAVGFDGAIELQKRSAPTGEAKHG